MAVNFVTQLCKPASTTYQQNFAITSYHLISSEFPKHGNGVYLNAYKQKHVKYFLTRLSPVPGQERWNAVAATLQRLRQSVELGRRRDGPQSVAVGPAFPRDAR